MACIRAHPFHLLFIHYNPGNTVEKRGVSTIIALLDVTKRDEKRNCSDFIC
jgi:hypothetical protein